MLQSAGFGPAGDSELNNLRESRLIWNSPPSPEFLTDFCRYPRQLQDGYVVAGFSPRSLSEHCVHTPGQNAG
jgi:hypothetical protein